MVPHGLVTISVFSLSFHKEKKDEREQPAGAADKSYFLWRFVRLGVGWFPLSFSRVHILTREKEGIETPRACHLMVIFLVPNDRF